MLGANCSTQTTAAVCRMLRTVPRTPANCTAAMRAHQIHWLDTSSQLREDICARIPGDVHRRAYIWWTCQVR